MNTEEQTSRAELMAEIDRLNAEVSRLRKFYRLLVCSIIHYYRRDCQGELDNTEG